MSKRPYVATVWWGELEDFQMVVIEAVSWHEALKELKDAAGLKKLPAEYEVISLVAVTPKGLDTELVNAYFEAGQKPQYGDHVDSEDQAAAGLWRAMTPTGPGPLNQYVITGTVWEDDLRFTQDLNERSLKDALDTVEKFYESQSMGAQPALRLYSAVELTHDGIVKVWWLKDGRPELRHEFPAASFTGKKQVQEALAYVNRYRRRAGQRPLDPVAAGWKDQDIILEAKRLGYAPNPVEEIKARMLAW